VSDWHSLPPDIHYDLESGIPGLVGPATVWAEMLDPTISDPQSEGSDLQVLARYSAGPFSSHAALTEHKVGAGRVLYLGWQPDSRQAETILAHLASQAGVPSLAAVPDAVIVSQRGPHLILLNFTDEPQKATVQGQTVLVRPRDVEVVRAQAG
jgi:beta-galactosidase